MWMPMRSWRTITGRMSALAAYSIRWLNRVAAEDLDPLALHDFRDGGAEFMAVSPLDMAAGLVRPISDSWNRI